MERILILNDEGSIRRLMLRYLKEKKVECTLATDAIEAPNHFEEWEFDVMFCDINKPWEFGLELFRDLRSKNNDRGYT
jgi:CheY-like chemotaxis protein